MEPWHVVLTALMGFIGVVSTLNALLLKSILGRLTALETKLETKRDAVSCDRIRTDCGRLRDTIETEVKQTADELWDAVNHHSHTGLPDGAKVIR